MARNLTTALAALALAACGPADDKTGGETEAAVLSGEPTTILAFGDSLFAGYNLSRVEAFPARLERALRRNGTNVRVHNAGVSGDTASAGAARLDFVLDSMTAKPGLVLVELGANDMLRGLPPEEAKASLDRILAELDRRDIDVVLMGMRAAPNLGRDYAGKFDAIYPELADKYDAALVPFFIEPLIFDRSLVQRDQIHPTAEGVDAMVATSLDVIEAAVDDLD